MFTRVEEMSEYNRHWLPPKVARVRTFSSVWTFTSDIKAPYPRVRLRLLKNDGDAPVIVGDWAKPTTRQVIFSNITADDGYYLELPEVENNADMVIPQPRIVNASGKALPERKPWTAADRFDMTHALAGEPLDERFYAQIKVPGKTVRAPKTYPLKPRDLLPIVNPANQAQLWVRRLALHQFSKLGDLFEVPTPGAEPGSGDVCDSRGMIYFWDEGVTYQGRANGLLPPIPPCRDGTRGWATFPYVGKAINRRGGPGTFMASTAGYLAFMNGEGARTTLGGWRLKPGMIQPHPSYRATDPDWYAAHFDFVGNTDLLRGPKRLAELWGFVPAEAFEPGNTHEFWCCDTMNDRVVVLNHWTAHPAASYQPMHFPPPGYTSPPGPTGESAWMDFITGHPLVKQPWGIAAHPQQAKFYITCHDSFGAAGPVYGGGSIVRCNRTAATVEGLEIEALHAPPPVEDWKIGVGARLADASQLGPFGTMIGQNDTPDVLCGRWFGKAPTDFAATADGDLTLNGVPVPGVPVATNAAQRVTQIIAAIKATSAQHHVTAWPTPDGGYSPLKGGTTIERIGFTDRQLVIATKDAAATERTGFESVTRDHFLVDGPADPTGSGKGASLIHPQDDAFLSDGTLVWAEQYTYVLRTLDAAGNIRTLWKIRPVEFAGTSSADHEISISIDDQDRIYVATWLHRYVISRQGTFLGRLGGTPATDLPPALASVVSPVDYGWAVAAEGGKRIVMTGNAGHTLLELTQRLPTDVQPDIARRQRGYKAMVFRARKSMFITHGTFIENCLGGPNIEELGAFSDAALTRYLTQPVIGVPPELVADAIYNIRSRTVDYVYPVPLLEGIPGGDVIVPTPPDDGDHHHEPPEDPAVIAELQQQVAALQDQIKAASATNTDLTTQLQAAQAKLTAAEVTQAHAAALQKTVNGFVGSMADLLASATNG